MVTLTYAEAASDVAQVRRDLADFVRALRVTYPPFRQFGAYLAVIEAGSKHGRLHVHVAIGQYVPRSAIDAAWGHGFVSVKRFTGAFGAQAATVAGYLAKYVGKVVPVGGVVTPGHHRYYCSQGHQPQWDRVLVLTRDEFESAVAEVLGEGLDVWRSPPPGELWRGPPAVSIRRVG